MIHIWEIRAPLGDVDGEAVTATLGASMDRVTQLYPKLRGATLETSEGVLVMRLRVSGRDHSAITRVARTIGSSMLRRAKLDVSAATMILVEKLPTVRDLRKVESPVASADPS